MYICGAFCHSFVLAKENLGIVGDRVTALTSMM